MVGGENARKLARQAVDGTVHEGIGGEAPDEALILKDLQISSESEASQREDSFWLESSQLGFEVRTAIFDFGTERLIGGRSAAHSDSNVRVAEIQAVVAADGSGLVGETGPVERVKQEIPGTVARESPACAIAAVRGGSKANDEKLGFCIAETREGLAPVVAVQKGTAFGTSDGFAIADQTRTLTARYNRLVEDF